MFIGWILLIGFWGLIFSLALAVLVSKCYKRKMQRKRSFLESQNCASTKRRESQLPQMPSIETKEGQKQFESGNCNKKFYIMKFMIQIKITLTETLDAVCLDVLGFQIGQNIIK